jgi:hypothetical protein
MIRTSYAEEICAARLMLAGMKANADKLNKRGIDRENIAMLEDLINEVTALEAEQAALMARHKEKTAALQEKVVKISKIRGNNKKLVKIDFAKESWREFGIMDKQ